MTTVIVSDYDALHSQEERVTGDIKQRMIQQAALSLARKGLQRTSFSEVLEASGAPRGSLYHHFPGGKDELVLRALDAAGDFAMQTLSRATGASASEVARAFVDLWRSVLARSDFSAGCAIAAVTVAADSPVLLERAADIFRGWLSRLAALLGAGGVPEERALALATTLISGCEGAVLLARAERSFAPFDLVAAELVAVVEAAIV
jgi:TetR/AcrR family transcriptional repressor of lmrAB and yxaGH operons